MDDLVLEDKIQTPVVLTSTNNSNEIEISNKKEEENKHFYYEIKTKNNSDIIFDYIMFKNFYVSNISLIAFCGSEKISLLNNYVLMNDPNTEEDSERYILISSKEFEVDESKFKELKISSMRLYIYQPSLYWNVFRLDNIHVIDSTKESQELKIYYEISPKNKYIFKEDNLHLLDDSEEINQKYIELANKGGNSYSKINFID